ncbi:MAG: xanthine dehydrogenase family protein [Candidatus Marinimicrobia bacterium]|nr:xanthine dehydrogenase family protein [Candidatus Neomarinimicrobiota bacterium]
MSYLGRSIKRVDGLGKVTGRTPYTPDLVLPGMVHAYPVFSNIPFGRITAIDLAAIKEAPGFIAIILAADIPGENQVGVIVHDQPLLADEVVRYVGDTIGLVVAETAAIAHALAELVQVKYEEYEPVLSMEAGRAGRGRLLHESNVACSHRSVRGDVEAGFSSSDLVVEGTFTTPHQEHFYLEPQSCLAIPEPEGGITIHGSLQCPYYVQRAVGGALGMSLARVRVVAAPLGGAFGGKEDVPSELCARAAVAAMLVGRPVKMVYDRRDDVQMTSKRHPFEMHYKVGVNRDGRLLAADVLLESNAGAYATLSSVVSYRAAIQALGPYRVENVRAISRAYYTNLPPSGAFRGFGAPQVCFGHERIMDHIAAELGIDPVELRLMNLIKPGDITSSGQRLDNCAGAEKTLTKARSTSGWLKRLPAGAGRYREGWGVATCLYGNGLGAAGWRMDGAGARLQLLRDGSLEVAYGLTDMGQGAITVVAQMSAEAVGVELSQVRVLPTDTANVPDSGPSVASRNVVLTGNAIRDAAEDLRKEMTSAAGQLLKCPPEQVEIEAGRVRDLQSGREIPLAELAEQMFVTNRSMGALGWWHAPPLDFDADRGQGEAYFAYSFAAQIARVKVDTVTGLVEVLKVWAAHDLGKAINVAGVEGQVEGAVSQAMGWALTEDLRMTDGRVDTVNFSTYLLPTFTDMAAVETIIIEEPEPLGPWGARGVGEPAIIPVAAAIANAVSDALGVPVDDLPITPEKVLALLDKADNGGLGTGTTAIGSHG